jgi:hypothetical protein
MDWIELARDRGNLQLLVNAVIDFRVVKMWEISRLAANRLAFQEGLCCVQ